MKKFIILLLLLLITSCTPNKDSSLNKLQPIPEKINEEGYNTIDSSITTKNLDDYLLRDDVFYCDLRYYEWVLKDGYIPGFTFIPYYDFIATRSGNNAFFRILDDSFIPIYNESKMVLNKLFPKDKKIFLVSQSGLESTYMSSLLVENGYDAKNIYNVGGVTNNMAGFPAYKSIGKHFVPGNKLIPNGTKYSVDFSKIKDLTLIEE